MVFYSLVLVWLHSMIFSAAFFLTAARVTVFFFFFLKSIYDLNYIPYPQGVFSSWFIRNLEFPYFKQFLDFKCIATFPEDINQISIPDFFITVNETSIILPTTLLSAALKHSL